VIGLRVRSLMHHPAFEEPIDSDFEILYALLVNEAAVFTSENGPHRWDAAALRRRNIVRRVVHNGSQAPNLSDSQATSGFSVNCRLSVCASGPADFSPRVR
jgi:hypothetical protein